MSYNITLFIWPGLMHDGTFPYKFNPGSSILAKFMRVEGQGKGQGHCRCTYITCSWFRILHDVTFLRKITFVTFPREGTRPLMRVRGPLMKVKDPMKDDQGPNEDQGPLDTGPGPLESGPGTSERDRESSDEGEGPLERGPGPSNEDQGPSERRPGPYIKDYQRTRKGTTGPLMKVKVPWKETQDPLMGTKGLLMK